MHAPSQPDSCSLLLVEDDVQFRELLARRLTGLGYHVTAVGHPRQALAAASIRNFEVAIVDRGLPEMNGVALLRSLKRLVGRLPVIILTGQTADGFDDDRLRDEAARHGAYGFLEKPCRLREIEKLLRRALADRERGATEDLLTAAGRG